MATHRLVPIEEVPDIPAPVGRGVSKKQRVVDEELEDSRDDLIFIFNEAKKGTAEQSVFFEFLGSEHEELRFTSPTMSTAKDSCRGMFRKALGKLELEEELTPFPGAAALFTIRYEFDLERLSQGEWMHRGFTVWVRTDLGAAT